MITLRIPNRSVTPADFIGRQGICQNLNCLAPLEPPYRSARWCVPGGTLETILCGDCMPEPWAGTHPEMRLEVVAAPPVLPPPDRPDLRPEAVLGLVRACDIPMRLPPPPDPGPVEKLPSNRRLAFRVLAQREPRLLDLLAEARAHHKNREPVFCANAEWYGYPGFEPGFKRRLCRLVGTWAEKGGVLRTSEAYDVAYQRLYRALPDCRGRCACSVIMGI